jgi:hypothetical protein
MPISPKALKWGLWGAPAQLEGQPGTKPVPVGRPQIPGASSRISAVGGISYSHSAPDVIYPSLYYVRGRQEHAPVSLMRTNNMPVPAGDLYKGPSAWVGGTQTSRLAQISARTTRVGGRFQTGWPSAPVSWPWGNQG